MTKQEFIKVKNELVKMGYEFSAYGMFNQWASFTKDSIEIHVGVDKVLANLDKPQGLKVSGLTETYYLNYVNSGCTPEPIHSKGFDYTYPNRKSFLSYNSDLFMDFVDTVETV